MIVALVLFGDAVVLATAGAWLLRRASWVDRAPRLAVVVWQALSISALLAMVFGGVALTAPTLSVSGGLAGLLDACVLALRASYATPGGALLATVGGVFAVGVLVRAVWSLLVTFRANARTRRRQHEVLALLGRDHAVPGVTVLEHGLPLVYCVAGRPHRIVVTSGAHDVLDRAQLVAVLAHERAHLRERHHVVVAAAAGLARAFPGVALFGYARDEVARLVELLADDAASRSAGDGSDRRLVLAEAMLMLAAQAPPAGALAARGTVAAARVRRLISGHRPFGAVRTVVGVVAAAAVLLLPAVVLSAPAAMAGPDCCASVPASGAVSRSMPHAGEECEAARADGSCPY